MTELYGGTFGNPILNIRLFNFFSVDIIAVNQNKTPSLLQNEPMLA